MNVGGFAIGTTQNTYRITPIQQPERGPVMNAPLSRVPVGPPVIIQLDTWDEAGEVITPYRELPFLVCHLTLQTPTGEDAQSVRENENSTPVPTLYGTTIASPVEMKDQNGEDGVYFVFPDICVRFAGTFRLKAYVMRITGGPALDMCITESFDVVPEQEYVAPAVTELTQHFAAQNITSFGPQPMQGAGDW